MALELMDQSCSDFDPYVSICTLFNTADEQLNEYTLQTDNIPWVAQEHEVENVPLTGNQKAKKRRCNRATREKEHMRIIASLKLND
jgi:hypothetical protein